ncbi:MAG: metalloregulator ArsR/SmtB family transcription factor [Proteobacteria bacterium]|nr:metalloregulator ArsR/SmtB family transcription factor [Pseudomonadota bacterium]
MVTVSVESHLPLLKVLANETRLRLIGLVSAEEQSVGNLARSLGLTEPTISHHLAKLSEAGLIEMRASGTTHYYRLNPKSLQSMGKTLFAQTRAAAPKPAEGEDGWEARVLQSFIVEGRVTKIPEGLRKRMVVLQWLANQFKDGRFYKEREVNEIIKRFHPDFATIRREFIGHGLMERESGTYWKTRKPHK